MADKKKMSVADILAAARKSDGGGSAAGDAAPEEAAVEETAAEEAAAEGSAAEETPAAASASARPEPGKKLSVAEMLAMARSTDKPGAKKAVAPVAKPKPKPAPDKAAAKPAAKAKPTGPVKGAPKDTASILAAARSGKKPGPMSKAEAAEISAKAKPLAKPKPVAPPMPTRPAYAQPKPAAPASKAKAKPAAEEDRRTFLTFGFGLLGGCTALWGLLGARFMFPNILTEPPTSFKVGPPDNFAPDTVETKFKAQFGVWIVNTIFNGERQIYALQTVCTHLGCTPNWLEAEQKYKCPCHGSGFYMDGINFEGPAPRPLERFAIRIADDGQLEVDKSKRFQEEMGAWADPASFVPV